MAGLEMNGDRGYPRGAQKVVGFATQKQAFERRAAVPHHQHINLPIRYGLGDLLLRITRQISRFDLKTAFSEV